ncbi:hypothetical protein PHLGIDRAFT_489049 [Phlebiopsis gigantea 11061_1 CR5-6]|uniref:Uncharacterized protein n=1 Tax=Phlebiopsis gigantea (strain 11061_1 CR5-6) TaxID=745531 RepID=A0A0C3P4H2_PHLG1|nr:hypothetical protein PHLGIDRAFT_489049 [Phlebiopsis gigantea 11061_1 CR5-6]
MVICDLDELQLSGLDELEPPPPYDEDYDVDVYDFWYSTSPPILAPARAAAPFVQQALSRQPTTRRVVANPRARPIFSPRLSHHVPSDERPNASILFLPVSGFILDAKAWSHVTNQPPLPDRYHRAERLEDAPDGLVSSTAESPPCVDGRPTQFLSSFSNLEATQMGDLDSLALPPRLPAYSPPEVPTAEDELIRILKRQGYSPFFGSGFVSRVSTKLRTLWSKIQHIALELLKFKRLKGPTA